MRSRIILLTVLFTSIQSLFAGDKPQDKLLTAQRFQQTVTKEVAADYLLFLPQDYQAKPADKWPLLLFLHGAGERGADVWKTDFHGPSKYILEHPEFPFILVSPLCASNETWSSERLFLLLEHVEKTLRVDERRIYLTGISMGGYGTWDMLLERPEKFAAAIPICGGADSLPIILAKAGYAPREKVEALKSLPIWVFHGAKDPTVPPEESQRAVGALKDLGVREIYLTLYPEAQHDSWTRTYNNPEIYSWLLKHSR